MYLFSLLLLIALMVKYLPLPTLIVASFIRGLLNTYSPLLGLHGYKPNGANTYQAIIWPQSSLPHKPSGVLL